MTPRVYLAGPDVFQPDPVAAGEKLKEACRRHGLEGVYPLDSGVKRRPREPGPLFARRIFEGNCLLIHGCQGVLANVSPFRGPSADVGTAWEMGYAHSLKRPIVAYSDSDRDYKERCGFRETDSKGMSVEDFDLWDNLMLACCTVGGARRTFEQAARELAALLAGGSRP